MRKIKLPCHGIVVTLANAPGGGHITHDEPKEQCPYCGRPDCCYDCDQSQGNPDNGEDEDVPGRLKLNGAVDGIMSLVLAHACAGVDIESPEYVEGIQTAIQACANNLA